MIYSVRTTIKSRSFKVFKPITETKKATTREITEGLKPIKEGIEAITFPAYPSIQASEGEETVAPYFIGDIAESYLRKFTIKDKADRKYGLYDIKGKFNIGNKPVDIKENNIVVDDEEYEGTPGLWELIVSKNPDETIYTPEDHENYARLVIKTSALRLNNDPRSRKPKSGKDDKWVKILSKIWFNKEKYEGSGVAFLLKDPNALLERLDLLLASQEAGNTGVRNELVSICNELKRQGVLNSESYKKILYY